MGALFQAKQLHIKYEGGIGRNDAWVPLAPVGKVRSAGQLGTLPHTHLLHERNAHLVRFSPTEKHLQVM